MSKLKRIVVFFQKTFKSSIAFLLFTFLFLPSTVSAHAFGQNYTLSIPFSLYFYGAGTVVILSFLVAGFFLKPDKAKVLNSQIPLPGFINRVVFSPTIKLMAKITSLGFFLLTILSGFFGSSDSLQNFNVVFFWIIFWLGFTYLSAIFGPIWSVLNPWKIIIELIELLTGTIHPKVKYPLQLGYLPALFFIFGFIWLELLSNGLAINPKNLSILITGYTFFTVFAVFIFGEMWFLKGEFFSVFFDLIAKVSPFDFQKNGAYVRFPFMKLTSLDSSDLSLLIFIIFILSSTAYDGVRASTNWNKIYLSQTQSGQTLMLILSPLVFLILYLLSISLIKILVKTNLNVYQLSLRFAFSLLPIALVYNIAHYFTLFLIQGQSVISIISDPFSLGWNLFGTSGYKINTGIIGAKQVWNTQVFLIVSGHVAAVIISHFLAFKIFEDHKKAIISQIPMLILMVFYTVFGLWILSQPLRIGG